MEVVTTSAFWFGSDKIKVSDYLLRTFLIAEGFSQFQSSESRLGKKEIVYNNDGVLEIHNSNSVKSWIRKYFDSIEDEEFEKDKTFGGLKGESYFKHEILSVLQSYSISSLESVLTQLEVISHAGYKDTIKCDLFNDKKGVAHLRFRNGVVRITKENIKLIPYSSVKDDGDVWESSIIQRDFSIDEDQGLFEKFCQKAFNFYNRDGKSESEYVLKEEQYISMRTSFGYLLHTYNDPSVPKCIYFIDTDSDLGRPQGGNGKSLIMDSINYFKPSLTIDGKVFRKSSDSGGQFQFGMIKPDTQFILIDDIRPDFDFDILFSKITGDMQVEHKNKDIVIIPKKDKPKFGLTTNYVIAGVGTSYKRRQHIVEFGNYWQHCNEMGESPSDKKHLGKTLFDEFTNKDWNQFYTYGFRCVQEYFQKGLRESSEQTHLNKSIKMEIDGLEGDGSITDWMDRWCKEDRLKNDYHKNGVSELDLYQKFIDENFGIDQSIWNLKKFRQSFFTYIDLKPEYDYNPQKSSRGNLLTDRRWQKGSVGKQNNWIKIVDVNNSKYENLPQDSKEVFFNSLKEEKVKNSNDEFDDYNYFKEKMSA